VESSQYSRRSGRVLSRPLDKGIRMAETGGRHFRRPSFRGHQRQAHSRLLPNASLLGQKAISWRDQPFSTCTSWSRDYGMSSTTNLASGGTNHEIRCTCPASSHKLPRDALLSGAGFTSAYELTTGFLLSGMGHLTVPKTRSDCVRANNRFLCVAAPRNDGHELPAQIFLKIFRLLGFSLPRTWQPFNFLLNLW